MIGHATWEGREVQPGEHVFLEVGGCYRRYHTAMMRTVVLGELSESMAHAQDKMKQALDAVHSNFQPGMTVSDADNMIRNILSDNHCGARLITRSGYSIGIAFPPSWDEGYIVSLKQGESVVLKEGMTFHIIPWLWGVDGDKTVGISDTIVITNDGCRSLFSLDRDFTVKSDQGAPNLRAVDSGKAKPDSKAAESSAKDNASDTASETASKSTGTDA